MKKILKSLTFVLAMSFMMISCGDDDECTTCELTGSSIEICPDSLDELTAEWGGATIAEVIAAIETQGGSCN